MLKHRIIVTILHDGKGIAVKPVGFKRPYRRVGSLMQHIKVQAQRDIDELILIDIEATPQNRTVDFEKIKEYAAELYCPLTIGGGINKLEHVRSALNAGADKVIVKGEIERNTNFISAIAKKYGSQVLVVAMDYNNVLPYYGGRYKKYEQFGAGEICLTNIDHDGSMKGYDIRHIEHAVKSCNIPIIANGGCGFPRDMEKALSVGAHAVAASSMFLYTDVTPKDCAKYLHTQGYKVRV